ncbi:phage holin family protein [Limnoraphis robusta Tam1]|uniref:Phage holin family protein n=1 Tax=Limnoraphis robusta CCNP1315 TaxID=3110306 RepID=A0ABU5TRI0_9CYAN|nr:phage holin family protein [Limnoraphis robusta]MEA5517522.1 phage holin family protein [Limnoraphis robusta CCNP1315]MEA5541267.1 phage holin family protein [Limnoraphis robusta Tam1]MEA5544676.1 phage holin family protein [Limnoraphis robusta CCNP1324]
MNIFEKFERESEIIMMALRSLLPLLATALSLLVVDIIFPGVNLATFPAALIAAASIGAVNWAVRPVVQVLSLPVNIVTLGGFSLIVNGLCFWLASVAVPGFQVSGILSFILGPVILSFVNTLLTNYFVERYPEANLE